MKDLGYSLHHWYHPYTLVHHSTSSQNLQHVSRGQLILRYVMKKYGKNQWNIKFNKAY